MKVGGATLSENVYQNDPTQPNYGTLTQMAYGNGMVVRNEYDDFNRVTGVTYGDETAPRYEYAYNAQGQVAHVRNNQLAQVAESEYDLSGRPCRVKTYRAGKHVYTGEAAYDDVCGRLSEFREKVGESRTQYATTLGYDEENRLTSLSYGGYGQSTQTYDKLGRVRQSSVKAGNGAVMTTTYAFEAGGHGENSTTGLVKSIAQTGGSFAYTYDDNGNITSVVQDGVTTAYTYDALGQLIRVDDGQENATWVYEYDQGGNILSKKKYALGNTTGEPLESKTFTYGNADWRDQLTAVDGVAITYDAIGNPLNDGEWTYTWQNGRQLASMTNGETTASFAYNENGLRVQKTVNGVVTDYTLHGKNIVHMKTGNDELHFFYDAQGKPAVVVYNGVPYSYVKNLQGDIVAILDSTGAVVVSYVYDAWGRPLATTGSMASTLGTAQPFRYRSYCFDRETQLCYLRSRYYKPNWCRFVNADALIQGNLFTYCSNSPINFHDPDGYEQITSAEDLYRLIAEQAVLEGGVQASEFLSRSNEVMNIGLPYVNSMEPHRGFVCSGYFLYYLDYTHDYGSSSAFRKLSSAVGYIEDIGWENLPTPLIIGQMVHNSSGKPVKGNKAFDANDIAKGGGRRYRVKHTGILRDVYYENGQLMFVVSQFTDCTIGPNGESGGLTLTFTLDKMREHNWNVWMYPEKLREDRCIPIPWLE